MCIQRQKNQIEVIYKEFLLVKKQLLKGTPTKNTVKLKSQKDIVFDIFTEDKERLHSLENQFGVKMSEAEYQYLESQLDHTVQRSDSKKICGSD